MATEVQGTAATTAETTRDPDEFASVLKGTFKPRSERQATEVEAAINTLVEQALQDDTLVKGEVVDTLDEMIARLDRMLSEQLNEVIHAPEFQSLESAWRGLNHLVMNSETDATLKIRVLNVGKDELRRELSRYPAARFDQSPVFKKIYEEEFGSMGGQPYGCLIGDYYFDHSPPDIQLMRDMGKIAATAHAPFFAAAAPSLMGMDSWTELMNPRDVSKLFDTPEYAAWKSLRDSEDARYLALCMPRVLSRTPYGAKTNPVEEFAFEEETDGHTGEKYGWMNAAYAMATNINRAYKESGWTVQIRGVETGGTVENLPTHTFPTDDGDIDLKCPTEIAITDRREAELSNAGLLPLIHRKNTDQATFIGAQSVYKPKTYRTAEDTASDKLSSRIPYMFAVSRFAHYLKCMVRDKVGSTKEGPELEMWLQDWISGYIEPNPGMVSEAAKARRPLAAAKVTVVENEEDPGYYSATFSLRPHYQLEGMDISLSLVSRLPQS
ncbi:type VI secretion protein, EvpB/ family [Hartmannibacter diazotrophicus]|uniref:Type VI secretion protein, EvpB/ family n=1 Tax=Hartmannibacter diazotrophicus TaxID=1482074 RepID=A0A2C9D6V3_9HYPH|nr:type VI secretion system contractile sheath large subunit [Hartmannibacter diazotrophicus]SON55878.1 type VI secretion protein, EvpB/ family [Hartmannibacter diazotrophicus]